MSELPLEMEHTMTRSIRRLNGVNWKELLGEDVDRMRAILRSAI